MTDISFAWLTSWQNMLQAFKRAALGKRSRPEVAEFEHHLDANLFSIIDLLQSNRYQPGSYHSFYIHEPKRRLISAACFRDQLVHHALCRIIEPLFEKSFIKDSYANRIGKGTHRALDRCQYFMRHYKYVWSADICQFFPSMDHIILRNLLAKKIVDCKILELCSLILKGGNGIHDEDYQMIYFPGDDLFAIERPRGLPIGNLTSQFWANVYLNPFDHFVKRELHCPAYLRYVDDFILFADSSAQLHSWQNRIIPYLARYRLVIHSPSSPKPVGEGISFLGFVVFPKHRRLKRRKGIYFQRKLRRMAKSYAQGEISFSDVDACVQGWINHARYGNTIGLRKALFSSTRFVRGDVSKNPERI